jgi:hypothetical protein
MANLGDASGEATIENDIAVFVPEAPGECGKSASVNRSWTTPNEMRRMFLRFNDSTFQRITWRSQNQQPQTKVRRRLMRMLEYNEMMSICSPLNSQSS